MFPAAFPRPGARARTYSTAQAWKIPRAGRPPIFPELRTDYLTCTNPGLLSNGMAGPWKNRSWVMRQLTPCILPAGANLGPRGICPPVPPAGLLATRTPSREAGPSCLTLSCPCQLLGEAGGAGKEVEAHRGRVIDDRAVPLNSSPSSPPGLAALSRKLLRS